MTNRLYIDDITRGLFVAVTSIILLVNVIIVLTVLVTVCGPLVRGFATHFIAPPSILPVPLRFPVPRLSTPPPVCCGAVHPLSRHQPLVGLRAYPHDFPYPHRSFLAPPSLPSAHAFFIYSVNSRANTDRLDHDERSGSRSSVKIL